VSAFDDDKDPGLLVHQEDPFNAESPPPVLVESALTPNELFYVRGHGAIPEADPAGHRVRITGAVSEPLELGVEDLRERFALRELTVTLECAGNRRDQLIAVKEIPGEIPWGPGTAGTARWSGISLADVLRAAGVREGSDMHVAFTGLDRSSEADDAPFGGSIPLTKALGGEVLLAYEMGGVPLPARHGGPLRALVPGYIGARSVKWVSEVRVQVEPSESHFQRRTYKRYPPEVTAESADPDGGEMLGPLELAAAICTPADGASVAAGALRLTGYATVAGPRRIAAVEISADGGESWTPATLREDQGPWAWRRWEAQVDLAPGPHELVARARDALGTLQEPADAAAAWNFQGYANTSWPRVRVTAG